MLAILDGTETMLGGRIAYLVWAGAIWLRLRAPGEAGPAITLAPYRPRRRRTENVHARRRR